MIEKKDLLKLDSEELKSKLLWSSSLLDRMTIQSFITENIFCPHCETRLPNDDYQYPINYHTGDEAVEMECPACNETFFVREHVERTYTVGITEEEAYD